MGGSGSGNYYRWDVKTKICDMLALDIRQMKAHDWLHDGFAGKWNWYSRGERIARIGFAVRQSSVHLDYSQNDESMSYSVNLDKTPCHYGGHRTWFLCPARGCGRRVAVLYGGKVFACRKCHDLAYASQSEAGWDRALCKADKIRDALGWDAGVANGWGAKPKGMHWDTFYKLTDKHDDACHVSNLEMIRRLGL